MLGGISGGAIPLTYFKIHVYIHLQEIKHHFQFSFNVAAAFLFSAIRLIKNSPKKINKMFIKIAQKSLEPHSLWCSMMT